MESWGSGLTQLFAKQPAFKKAHKFESYTFRQYVSGGIH